ncbi:MAG: hypothetical protein LBP83_02080 [Dysgonamonadaceae bacterium]|jgi:hypothetical protein|nr:hypothetical protein [Dysgonamonadaceae bacterium]
MKPPSLTNKQYLVNESIVSKFAFAMTKRLLIRQLAHSFTCQLVYLSTRLLVNSFTCQLVYLSTRLLVNLFTYETLIVYFKPVAGYK